MTSDHFINFILVLLFLLIHICLLWLAFNTIDATGTLLTELKLGGWNHSCLKLLLLLLFFLFWLHWYDFLSFWCCTCPWCYKSEVVLIEAERFIDAEECSGEAVSGAPPFLIFSVSNILVLLPEVLKVSMALVIIYGRVTGIIREVIKKNSCE